MDKLDQIRASHSCVKGGEKTYLYLISQLEKLFPDLKRFFRYSEVQQPSSFIVKMFTTNVKGTGEDEIITFSIARGEEGPEITYSCSLHGTRTVKTSRKDHSRLFAQGNAFLDLLVLCETEKITP
ncbi:MAG: hypothetical protein HZA35_01970 [Parcubacteria group bacterium]|nr:hypothetical protein [Parcubacteria group bacterium]